jgi:hypothetical protein
VNKYTTLLKTEGFLRDRDDATAAIPSEEGTAGSLTGYELNELNEITSARRDAHTLKPAVVAMIAAIEPAALALGWSHERLWNHELWPHTETNPRGLASCLDAGDRIGEVHADHITIHKRDRAVQTFCRSAQSFWRTDA